MIAASFSHVDTWVFDLDNTLYHPSARLFDQIEAKMVAWIMRELRVDRKSADEMRGRYWAKYGTTLSGLMCEHQIDPWDFLLDVHDIDFTVLSRDAALRNEIAALPGRRIIFTNGDAPYATKVLAARGLENTFDAIYGIEHTGWRPKPKRAAFDAIITADGFDPKRASMFEDDPRNLAVPFEMGMRTVLVTPEPMDHTHIQHHTGDLTDFLSQIARTPYSDPANIPS